MTHDQFINKLIEIKTKERKAKEEYLKLKEKQLRAKKKWEILKKKVKYYHDNCDDIKAGLKSIKS